MTVARAQTEDTLNPAEEKRHVCIYPLVERNTKSR
jgi:hypothetical protein